MAGIAARVRTGRAQFFAHDRERTQRGKAAG
jgi:hypothetical protein